MSSSHKALEPSRHHSSIDSCALQLHSWRPFIDSSDPQRPTSSNGGGVVHQHHYHTIKRPCLSDRATSLPPIDAIDISRLSLIDDYKPISAAATAAAAHNGTNKRGNFRLLARKRRRRGSRSVSGRSSDRSGTRRCCSVGATCSDFPAAVGTDSSGELFGNANDWASDVSEAKNSLARREREEKEMGFSGGGGGGCGVGFGLGGAVQSGIDAQGNESGYGSEPGYRGDAEFGYGDEFDEEEDDARLLFWGDHIGGTDTQMEGVGENTFADQKAHYRCRRKKHDCRMVYSLR